MQPDDRRVIDDALRAASNLTILQETATRFRVLDERNGRAFQCGRREAGVLQAFADSDDVESLRHRIGSASRPAFDSELASIARQLESARVLGGSAAPQAASSLTSRTWWLPLRREGRRPWNPSLVLLLGLTCTLVAVSLTWPLRWELARAFRLMDDLSPGQLIVVAAVATVGIGFVHETAHAFSALALGARTIRIGIGIRYGVVPIAVTDLSPLNLQPSRAARIAATLMGPAASLCCGAMALLGLSLVSQDDYAASVLAGCTLFGLLVGGLNLVPLGRSDGYYILTDLLRFPNLQARAWRVLRTPARWARNPMLTTYGILNGLAVAGLAVASLAASFRLFGPPGLTVALVVLVLQAVAMLAAVVRRRGSDQRSP